MLNTTTVTTNNNKPVISALLEVSRFTIDYDDGFFVLSELTSPISKHNSLYEANMVKSTLEA